MSTIPIQQLVLDTDTDIGLTSDLINGTYKSSSLTDLSNNVYTKISDLSSNVYTQLNSKQPTLTALTNLVGMGNNITTLDYNKIALNKPTNFQSDWNSTIINKPDLTVYAIKSNVDTSLNTINSTLATKQNTISVSTPLIKDVSNNITIDLSAYPLKTYVDGSLNTINSTLSTKQNTITAVTPLKKDVSNNISIDLSGYTLLSSFNTLSSTVSTKENALTFTTPLTRTTNTISIDLSGYTLLSSFNTLSSTVSTKENALTFTTPLARTTNTISIDLSYTLLSSFNTLSSTVSTKENALTFTTPLTRATNTIGIDLSGYHVKSYVDGSLNTINTALGTKQNTLTFSNPFLNTSNTISLKYNSAQFNIDASGNLNLISGTSSQWTTSGANIYYNTGIVGISTTSPIVGTKLDCRGIIYSQGIIVGDPNSITANSNDISGNNNLLIAAPTATNAASIQTIKQGTAFMYNLSLQPNAGNVGIRNSNPNLTLDIGSTNGNHNIGRAILTAGNIHNADKLDSLSIGRWDGSNTTDWQFSGIRYNVTTGTAVGESASNHSNMSFWTWGNSISNTREVMRLTSRGRLGINTTAPTELLDVNGNIKCSGSFGINATSLLSRFTIRMNYGDGNTGGFCIDSADTTNTYNLRIFSYVQAGSQVGYHFQVNNIASSVNAITLNYDGGVNIGNYLRIAGRSIYNNLFNSSGYDHGTITNFNSITDFGYRFINAPATNGPGTPSNPELQYYTWMIGLGSSYNYDYFGAQFCLPRNAANPVLSVRYKEAYNWGGWTGITAEALTSGNKTISGNLTVNGNTSIYGYVGIGSNGSYPLHVFGGAIGANTNVYVRTGYNGGADFNYTGSYSAYISAAFSNSIYVQTYIINSSDIRIKKEINDIDDDGALQKILLIQPKTYKYIDVITRGSSIVYGFIAQQVKEVLPEAVSIVTDTIPNIYKQAKCNNNIITFEEDISNDLNINDKIKIYDDKGNEKLYKVNEINSNIIEIDDNINSSDVFIYGKEINDFNALNKDYIFTLNVCATQELYKLIQQQNIIIQDLQNRIDILENK